ncbi:dUTPase [Desulfoferrobacter suflitae]|uniref:dUTPase n=1 Tax=Desulfoferrobacter suflitae TaxID=2865782 RepID=UPI002164BE6C|nr:dUTPase [Desulfoferrobacter suflitae]MCK8602849.1 dUTPase [Desulfoferrobacter suflitae]
MKQIFDLQWKLNTYTLNKIGIDYRATITDPQQKPLWIDNYRKALSAELAELTREVKEFGIGTDNGKIEIVDMLHFLVSLSHIVGLSAAQLPGASACKAVEKTDQQTAPKHGLSFDATVISTFLNLDDLQNSLKWKWWARGGGFDSARATRAVMDLWDRFYELCAVFRLEQAQVKRIYLGKNEINFRRQDENYNEDTKTEEDNEALKAAISQA